MTCEACHLEEVAWAFGGYLFGEECMRGFLRGDVVLPALTSKRSATIRRELRALIADREWNDARNAAARERDLPRGDRSEQ